jgi:hypothetical protein
MQSCWVHSHAEHVTHAVLHCAVQTLQQAKESEAFQQGRREGLGAVEGAKESVVQVGVGGPASSPSGGSTYCIILCTLSKTTAESCPPPQFVASPCHHNNPAACALHPGWQGLHGLRGQLPIAWFPRSSS